MSKKTKPKFQSTEAREKYDQEFSEAMKLKLKLNREGGLTRRYLLLLSKNKPPQTNARALTADGTLTDMDGQFV